MTLVRASRPEEAAWLTSRTGYEPGPGMRGIVAERAGRLWGFVALDEWTPASCSMHVALEPGFYCRALLFAAFDYLFNQQGRRLARGEVRAGNGASLNLALHLGFTAVYAVQDGWEVGEDLVLLEMRRHECRWLKVTS